MRIIDNIVNASGDQWLGFLVIAFLLSLCTTGIIALNSDHTVHCYYMKTMSTDAGIAYRIKGDIDYAEDITAFTTPDPQLMLETMGTLNQCAGITNEH